MNKLGTALCLSSALLACVPAQAAWQGNWLVGASGGFVNQRGELEITMLDGFINPGEQTVTNRRFEDTNWYLGLLGGYQVKCNRWLLGTELNIDWRNIFGDSDNDNLAFTDTNAFGWNASSNFQRNWVIGLTGRMGYEIAPYLLPYVRAGLEWSQDKLGYIQTRNDNLDSASGDSNRDSLRVIAGLGLEVPIPTVFEINGLSVRGEYDYHTKPRTVNVTTVAADGATLVSASRKPNEQTFIVSLIWNI